MRGGPDSSKDRTETKVGYLLPGVLFYVLWIGMGLYLGHLFWDGFRFDKDLSELRRTFRSFDALPREGKPNNSVFVSYLPSELASLVEGRTSSKEDAVFWLSIAPTWLQCMRSQMGDDKELTSDQTRALAYFALFRYRGKVMKRLPPEIQAEVTARMSVCLVDAPQWSHRSPRWIVESDSDAAIWKNVLDILLSKPDIEMATPINIETSQEYFLHSMRFIEHWPLTDPEPGFFDKLKLRKELNSQWRNFKAGLPYEDHPFPSKEAYRQYKKGDPENLVSRLYRSRLDLMTTVILGELKRLEALGEPLPRELSELRTPIRELAQAYSSWFKLKGNERAVMLEVEPEYSFEEPDIYLVQSSR